MRSRIEVGDNGSKGSLVVEVPRGTSTTTRPDPEAPARAKRRRFTARYKLRILEEADRLPGPLRSWRAAASRRVVFLAVDPMASCAS